MAPPALRRCRRCGLPREPRTGSDPCPRCRTPVDGGPPAGPPSGLGAGVAAFFCGAVFVFRNPRLLPWVLVPLAVVLLTAAVLAVVGFLWAGDLAPGFATPWAGWIEWARGPARWLAGAGIRIAGGLAGVYVGLALSGLVTSPLEDLLSEKAEERALGIRDPGRPWSAFLADAARGAAAALVVLLCQAIVMAPLFLLSFFALGAPLFAAAGALFAGLGTAAVVLGRKRYSGGERLAWARGRWLFLLGLGAPVSLLPLLLPFAVVGATLAYLDDGAK